MKRCEWCENSLALSEFDRAISQPDKRQPVCRECHRRRRDALGGAPRQRKRSPYDNMAEVLNDIEIALHADLPQTALNYIKTARDRYALAA